MKTVKNIVTALMLVAFFSCNTKNEKGNNVSEVKHNNNLKEEKSMNVLFVLTSHDELGDTGEKTGFWVEEFASPYYILKDKGVNITLATPKGGKHPLTLQVTKKMLQPNLQNDLIKTKKHKNELTLLLNSQQLMLQITTQYFIRVVTGLYGICLKIKPPSN
jgi:hypothetical protein